MERETRNDLFFKEVAQQLLPYLINHEANASDYYMNEN